MTKWEYKYESIEPSRFKIDYDDTLDRTIKILNESGKEGWESVLMHQVSGKTVIIFRRPTNNKTKTKGQHNE